MQRRDFLRVFGAASALTLLPHEAEAAWLRVAAGRRPSNALSDAQLAFIGALGDTILPRTDSPSATDVAVPAFVDVIVSENYSDPERAAFLKGLDAIDAQVRVATGSSFADLTPDARGTQVQTLESATDRRSEPTRTYWRLKSLIVHGYFTSEPVMKGVLKVEIMPGAFNGSAPMPTAVAPPSTRGSHEHV